METCWSGGERVLQTSSDSKGCLRESPREEESDSGWRVPRVSLTEERRMGEGLRHIAHTDVQ